MPVSNIIEKLGRVIFEAPFGGQKLSRDTPELAEIRLAVLDAVKAKAHRAGGRLVFPYNLIRVELLGVPANQSAIFRSSFLADYFAEELRTGLTRSGYRFPSDLHVELVTTETMPGPNETWLRVETEIEEGKPEPVLLVPQYAKLTVVVGKADPVELTLDRPHVNIGRTREAVPATGPTRLNDIAFREEEAAGKSVSRQHAHIDRDNKTGSYRLFNDRIYKGSDNCGVFVVRAGENITIHRGGHGLTLEHGDEIHLAQAVLRFEQR
jgi:hypothetical protein